MMLYPSVQEMTDNKINCYSLVIATAKGARLITDKSVREREEGETRRESDRFSKDSKPEITADSVNEKAVSKAIDKIHSGEYKIIVP